MLTVQLGVVVQRRAYPDEDRIVERAHPVRADVGRRRTVSHPRALQRFRAAARAQGCTVPGGCTRTGCCADGNGDLPVCHDQTLSTAEDELLAPCSRDLGIERLCECESDVGSTR